MPSSVANEGYKFQTSGADIGSGSSSSSSSGYASPASVPCTPVTPPPDMDANDNATMAISEQLQLQPAAAGRSSWQVKASSLALNTNNRIRNVVESLTIEPNPNKPMIPLSIGDPTTFGNLKAADETMKAVLKSLESGKFNGYAHTQGHEAARRAVAKYSAHQQPDAAIDPSNVFLCSGCSAALEYCILVLAGSGQNILVPRPGFCLYQTLAEGLNIEVRQYNLLPDQQWCADLRQLESLIDDKTAAVLINNPNNPCGSVFPKSHLQQIVNICERHYVPIIADEIYEHFVFPGSEHIAVSSLTKEVPVLSCGGLTKRFLVPGWRMGWIVVHDRQQRFTEVLQGLRNMCGRILGTNTIIQGALPDILSKTPQRFFDSVIDVLYTNAQLAYKMLTQVRGLKPVMPQGAMYMMIGLDMERFPSFTDEKHFAQRLVSEQSVFCLPASCFDYPGYVRIVLTVPAAMIEEACTRIAEFCEQHYKKDTRAIIEHTLLDEAY